MLYRLCLFFVRSLVDKPEQVRIDRIETERVDLLFIHVGNEDRGHLLGRGGRTIAAIRTFLDGVATRLDREVVIELAD